MLENYITQISFAMTTFIAIFIGSFFFKGGKGWTKTVQSGHLFSPKLKGFLWFFAAPLIIAALSPFLYQIILSFLSQHIANLIWILLLFFGALWIYYCKEHNFNIIWHH